MNTLKIDDKWAVEYDTDDLDRPYTALRYGMANHGNQPSKWGDCEHAMFYALLEAREVRNETAEADRPLEPPRDYSDLGMTSEAGAAFELMCEDRDATEGTHIHAALLAQESTGLFVTGLNAEEMEELRVLGQRTGGLIEFNPGKRKPMDSAGDLIRNYPDLASDLAADDEFTASFLNALADRVHATNVEADWWSNIETGESTLHTRNVPEMLMLIVSEISEALESVRKNLMDDKLPHRPGLIVELADAVIRILDLAGSRMAIERDAREQYDASWMSREGYEAQYGAEPGYEREPEPEVHPFGTVLVEKMAYNRTRSDHQIANRLMHGGKKI